MTKKELIDLSYMDFDNRLIAIIDYLKITLKKNDCYEYIAENRKEQQNGR